MQMNVNNQNPQFTYTRSVSMNHHTEYNDSTFYHDDDDQHQYTPTAPPTIAVPAQPLPITIQPYYEQPQIIRLETTPVVAPYTSFDIATSTTNEYDDFKRQQNGREQPRQNQGKSLHDENVFVGCWYDCCCCWVCDEVCAGAATYCLIGCVNYTCCCCCMPIPASTTYQRRERACCACCYGWCECIDSCLECIQYMLCCMYLYNLQTNQTNGQIYGIHSNRHTTFIFISSNNNNGNNENGNCDDCCKLCFSCCSCCDGNIDCGNVGDCCNLCSDNVGTCFCGILEAVFSLVECLFSCCGCE